MSSTFVDEEEYFSRGSRAEFWYTKAQEGYVTFNGDRGKFLNQAALWLPDVDLDYLDMAWDLVEMEHENDSA